MLDIRWFRVLVSLLLAAFLWLSVRLTRVYNTVLDVPLRYVNLPSGLKPLHPLPSHLRLSVNGRGHRLLLPSTNLLRDSLEVDLGGYLERGYLPTRSLTPQLENRLPEQTILTGIRPDTLQLRFAEKIRKRVPVQSRLGLRPAPGYQMLGRPRLTPDSVWLTATARELRAVEAWPSQDTTLYQLREGRRFWLPLQPSAEIGVSPQQVQVRYDIQQLTERRFQVVPLWAGVQPAGQLRLIPERVTLICQLPFERYEQLSEADFEVEVHMPETPTTAVLPLRLRRKPDFVQQVRLQPAAVRYVISR